MSGGIGGQLFGLARTLAIGPFFSQFLFFAASPILTRLYSPTQFAAIAAFLLCGTAVASVACLKLDNAIIRTVSFLDAARIGIVAIISASVISVLLFVLSIVAICLLERTEYMVMAILMSPYILIGALYDVMNALALRRRLVKIVTMGRLVLAVSSLSVQIMVGFLEGGATGFVFGLLIGYAFSVIYIAMELRIKPLYWLRRLGFNARLVLSRNRHDWLYGCPSALFLTLQNNLPAVAFSFVAGAAAGGYYTLIQRVVFNPVIIVVGIVGQSVLPWLSRTRDQGSTLFLAKISSTAVIAMIGLVVAIYPFCADIFAFIFGEQWLEAGAYAGILFLLLPYRVLYDVLSILLIAENRQSPLFLTRMLSLLMGIAVLFGFPEISTRDLFLLFSFSQAVCALGGVFVISLVLRIQLPRLLLMMFFALLSSYFVVVFEGQLSIFLGASILTLFFGISGVLIFAISFIAMKSDSGIGLA